MSAVVAGNQRGSRINNDDYPTDPAWVPPLFDVVSFPEPIWEPAAGQGAMVRAIRSQGLSVRSSDITTGQDFLTSRKPRGRSIVTNPPYSLATPFIQHALSLVSHVAMLLPIGYLGGLRRIDEIWASTPPAHVVVIGSRMVVHGRPSQFNHVWVAWEPETTETRLHWAAVERTHSRDMSVYK